MTPPLAPLQIVPHRLAAGVHDAAGVDAHHPVPHLVGQLIHRDHPVHDARVVEENVHLAKLPDGEVHHGLHLVALGDVHLEGPDVLPVFRELLQQGHHAVIVQIGGHTVRPLLEEQRHGGFSDAGAGPGDHGHLSPQRLVVPIALFDVHVFVDPLSVSG